MTKAQADDLLDDMDGAGFDEGDDLLASVLEDDSEGWVPENPGDGVQGVVVKVGETKSDFSDEMAPTVTIETASGEKYRIIGYGSVLRRELVDADPHPGDLLACKYFGEKKIKNGKWAGKNYKHFGVALRRQKVAS